MSFYPRFREANRTQGQQNLDLASRLHVLVQSTALENDDEEGHVRWMSPLRPGHGAVAHEGAGTGLESRGLAGRAGLVGSQRNGPSAVRHVHHLALHHAGQVVSQLGG